MLFYPASSYKITLPTAIYHWNIAFLWPQQYILLSQGMFETNVSWTIIGQLQGLRLSCWLSGLFDSFNKIFKTPASSQTLWLVLLSWTWVMGLLQSPHNSLFICRLTLKFKIQHILCQDYFAYWCKVYFAQCHRE